MRMCSPCKKNKIVLAKYKDGHWYAARIIKLYKYKDVVYYLEWLDGSKDDRVKHKNSIKHIPNNTEYDAGIDYLLLASLLF